jgi:hypothetical protein|tara:strand:+ start:829 stop:1125 length:297 start_codon:yes stop_codon:yes gene_type:complete
MKHTKKEISQHLSKVAELGCIVCRKMGYPDTPAEIHHIKNGSGIGKKSSHLEAIPLCAYHHRISNEAFHHSPKKFTEKWGTQQELLGETKELLYGRQN